MKKKKTQTSEILKYMKFHKKGITSKEAFELFGATRLSGLIFMLKKQGYHIKTDYVPVRTRYGDKTIVARYSLIDNFNPKKVKKS